MFQFKEKEGVDKIALIYQNLEAIDDTIIRKKLMKHLARYEIPHIVLNIAEMPLTANGKIDIKALKESTKDLMEQKHSLVEVNMCENDSLLIEMLKEILKVQNVLPEDSLFALGADSLQLVRIKNDINDKYEIYVEMLELYDCDSIQEIEKLIEEKTIDKEVIVKHTD